MTIEKTSFGSITVDGKTYDHDILINKRGEIKKRKKKLSKKIYGTSHLLSLEETEYIYEKGITDIVIGNGQDGMLHLSKEARDFLKKKGCRVHIDNTPGAVEKFNRLNKKKIGLFHVTC